MRVRLFAALRELAGTGELELDAPDVASLLAELTEKFGEEFGRVLQVSSVLVDGEPAPRERELRPEDEVAVLPPVSGG